MNIEIKKMGSEGTIHSLLPLYRPSEHSHSPSISWVDSSLELVLGISFFLFLGPIFINSYFNDGPIASLVMGLFLLFISLFAFIGIRKAISQSTAWDLFQKSYNQAYLELLKEAETSKLDEYLRDSTTDTRTQEVVKDFLSQVFDLEKEY